jgi:predicted alpha/beta-hydrolase family hydrolase
MPAEKVDLRFDGPDTGPLVVLTHGAGGPMDDPFLETIAAGLAANGLRVARFEFPYMAGRRKDGRRRPPDRQPVLLATWRSVVDALGGGRALVLGGKSMGGRMASLVADEVGARGLVCLGYPFHPPGRATELRTAHLASLRTPTLVVQGTRDPFGTRDEVAGYRLSPAIALHWIEDGDHSLVPRRSRARSAWPSGSSDGGRTRRQNLDEALEAVVTFVARL